MKKESIPVAAVALAVLVFSQQPTRPTTTITLESKVVSVEKLGTERRSVLYAHLAPDAPFDYVLIGSGCSQEDVHRADSLLAANPSGVYRFSSNKNQYSSRRFRACGVELASPYF